MLFRSHILPLYVTHAIRYCSKTRGIDFNFPPKQGRGIEKMLPHVGRQPVELIYKMCEYDPDERITAKQALRHPYFKELRSALNITPRVCTLESALHYSHMWSQRR